MPPQRIKRIGCGPFAEPAKIELEGSSMERERLKIAIYARVSTKTVKTRRCNSQNSESISETGNGKSVASKWTKVSLERQILDQNSTD
jgi:hypothetical protein